ncbi:Crp/Fnr family transcriptional regulator [Sphingobacterium sp. Mn56C]|uniref:Crp/Fnr family transcriptional regulator n=1 Tax=Sphingobacterium sp. Mn56C TaxID=3395261 RepID=UPI003BDC7C11
MTLESIINKIYNIPLSSRSLLAEHIEEMSLTKGKILLKANKVEHAIYLIKSGIVRAYSDHEDGEITFWFGEEGEAILSMKSYVQNARSYENIELLEDCVLYKISIHTLTQFYEKDIHIANWGRKLAENELLKVEERLISRELLSAKQRYDKLLEQQPSLLKRVPLKHIASYLGITPVSLSRIRKER